MDGCYVEEIATCIEEASTLLDPKSSQWFKRLLVSLEEVENVPQFVFYLLKKLCGKEFDPNWGFVVLKKRLNLLWTNTIRLKLNLKGDVPKDVPPKVTALEEHLAETKELIEKIGRDIDACIKEVSNSLSSKTDPNELKMMIDLRLNEIDCDLRDCKESLTKADGMWEEIEQAVFGQILLFGGGALASLFALGVFAKGAFSAGMTWLSAGGTAAAETAVAGTTAAKTTNGAGTIWKFLLFSSGGFLSLGACVGLGHVFVKYADGLNELKKVQNELGSLHDKFKGIERKFNSRKDYVEKQMAALSGVEND